MTQSTIPPLAADMSNVSDARAPKSALPKLTALAAVVLMAGAGWLWFQRHQAAGAVSPLEPTAATISVLVPAQREAVPSPAPSALAKAAVASVDGAATAASAVVDTVATLRAGLNLLTGRVDALESHDRTHSEQIAALRSEVDGLKAEVAAAASAASASAPASGAAATGAIADSSQTPATRSAASQLARRRAVSDGRRVASAKATPPASATPTGAEGSVLAVDLWGGKPSVALARSGASGTELRFFNEGETQGRVTVKHADIGTQKATFSTPSGEFTLAPKEQ